MTETQPAGAQPGQKKPVHVAAIIAITSGVISLFVLPFLFGAVAIIAGAVGAHKAQEEGYEGGPASVGGLFLGLIGVIFAFLWPVLVIANL